MRRLTSLVGSFTKPQAKSAPRLIRILRQMTERKPMRSVTKGHTCLYRTHPATVNEDTDLRDARVGIGGASSRGARCACQFDHILNPTNRNLFHRARRTRFVFGRGELRRPRGRTPRVLWATLSGTSSIHDKPAIMRGNPTVVSPRSATCRTSSRVAPASNARRV